MKMRGKAKRQSGAIETATCTSGISFDSHTKRSQHIGASTATRNRTVAVLHHWHPSSGRDERCRRADVERLATIATGPTSIENALASGGQRKHVFAKDDGGRGQFERGFSFHSECDQHGGHFRLARLSGHQGGHEVARLRFA
jgi:hypothetical protein